jgi:hypothetical protein
MTSRRRLAANAVRVLAWVLLVVGLSLIALNPFPPSLRYALLGRGFMAIARGIARLAAWMDVAVDLSLLFVCFFGIEIGGLVVVPSVVAFALADALRLRPTSEARDPVAHGQSLRARVIVLQDGALR